METKIIEADQDGVFYGKFMVARFTEEWKRPSIMDNKISLLHNEGWGPDHILIVDLSRPGNGSIFAARKNGYPTADLTKKGLRDVF